MQSLCPASASAASSSTQYIVCVSLGTQCTTPQHYVQHRSGTGLSIMRHATEGEAAIIVHIVHTAFASVHQHIHAMHCATTSSAAHIRCSIAEARIHHNFKEVCNLRLPSGGSTGRYRAHCAAPCAVVQHQVGSLPHLARWGEVPPPWSPSHSASSEEDTGLESASWLAKLLFSPACRGGMLSGMPGPCSS